MKNIKKFKRVTNIHEIFDGDYGWHNPESLIGAILSPFIVLFKSLITIAFYPFYVAWAMSAYYNEREVHWEEITSKR